MIEELSRSLCGSQQQLEDKADETWRIFVSERCDIESDEFSDSPFGGGAL